MKAQALLRSRRNEMRTRICNEGGFQEKKWRVLIKFTREEKQEINSEKKDSYSLSDLEENMLED